MDDFCTAYNNRGDLGFWKIAIFGWIVCLFSWTAQADIVTLKDGTTLRCQVVESDPSSPTNAQYLAVRIGQSVIWINRSAIDRVEEAPAQEPISPEIEELVERLMKEGVMVPTIDAETEDVSPLERSREKEIAVSAKEIRGWAYLYENEKAKEDGVRTMVNAGDAVPAGYYLAASPNTRMTLEMPDIGLIGVEAGTQIRIDEASQNRSRRSYSVSFRIDSGRCWLNIQSKERVILTVNSIHGVVPKNAIFYVETREKTGAIDVTYIRGEGDLQFSRNRRIEAPYPISPGQVLRVDPGINRLPVETEFGTPALQEKINEWGDWRPEPLATELTTAIPPFETFPFFRALPALHPYKLTIDSSLLMPPETRSMGKILAIYREALERYKFDTGRYPSYDHGLEALIQSFEAPGWKGPYIGLDLPRRDAWGNPYVYDLYTVKGRKIPDVRSMGQNGQDDKGLGDDIR
ncbi:MAG: type II secretion system protein GspG [Candidatus Omnitrophica bacterium]|nr:type II secretion system protein GspG [Candidatus Omnitrophota bacterium]